MERLDELELDDFQKIGELLESPDWTDGEKLVIQWQFRLLGSFHTKLFELLASADLENLARLSLAYPEAAGGYQAWIYGDLGERLRKAGLPV